MNDQMPPVTEEPKKNNTLMIIAIVVIVLCCCCVGIAGGVWLWNNGDSLMGTGMLLQSIVN